MLSIWHPNYQKVRVISRHLTKSKTNNCWPETWLLSNLLLQKDRAFVVLCHPINYSAVHVCGGARVNMINAPVVNWNSSFLLYFLFYFKVLNLVLQEAQMTFTKFWRSIDFCIFFFHISARCQLIEKINFDLEPLSGVHMIAKSCFWVSHLLLHTDLKLPHFLEWILANFQIVWWLFSSLGKPRFDTISSLAEH